MIEYWKNNDHLDETTANKLKASYSIRKFDWKKLAEYSLWIAVSFGIISIGVILADDFFLDLIDRLYESSDLGISITLATLAAGTYFLGLRGRKRNPHKMITNETLLFLGVVFTAGAITYLGKAFDTGSGHFSLIFLLSTVVYALLATLFRSTMVWVFAILCLGIWFGTESGYITGWNSYFWGMNYPMRFVVFGAMLTALSFLLNYISKLKLFFQPTYVMGLLYLFVSLWLLSIFGNYGDLDSWSDSKQIEQLPWVILLGLTSIGAIFYGLKQDDSFSRSFGVVFLLFNLYTRYVEYLWDSMHKALFFMVLAITFWLIGRKAESIWSLEFITGKKTKKSDSGE